MCWTFTVSSMHLTSLAAPQHPRMESTMIAAPIATTTPTDAINMLLLIKVLEKERDVHIQSPTASATAPATCQKRQLLYL